MFLVYQICNFLFKFAMKKWVFHHFYSHLYIRRCPYVGGSVGLQPVFFVVFLSKIKAVVLRINDISCIFIYEYESSLKKKQPKDASLVNQTYEYAMK